MNVSDLIHSAVTGKWRLERAHTKELLDRNQLLRNQRMMLYAGAEPGRQRPSPNILSTPEDFRQAYERIVLIRAARQMEEDMPFFDGILGDFETYVVGELRYLPGTGNPEADALIAEFLEWQFDQCDNSQRLDLVKIARLAVRSMKRDGECAFVMIDKGDSIKLDYISGDRIGNPLVGANIGPNNYNGIITDEVTGAPVYFDIFKRLPKLNSYVFQARLPANDVIHYYAPFRFEQYHGVSEAKNSIEHAFDMKQIMDFTKLNIKWRSSQLPYVTNEQGQPRGNTYEVQSVDSNGTPRPFDVQVGGVTQSFLKLGEGIMNYPNDFPNTQFKGIMEELKRDCAAGFKLPLEFCFRSETGGVVQRFYANKAERTFDEDKRWLRRVLLNTYKNRVIQKGIDTGFLDLSKFGSLSQTMARFKGHWQMGRDVSVDYSKEVDADIKLVEGGLMSAEDYVSHNGGSLEAVRQQNKTYVLNLIKDAEEIAEATKQPIEIVLPYLVKRFPNQAPRVAEEIVPDEPKGVTNPPAGAKPPKAPATP